MNEEEVNHLPRPSGSKRSYIMRLWHQLLIPYLPSKQLLGQHRECCALRGNGWGKKHATVNYVFSYRYEILYNYHIKIMDEMKKRGYKVDENWLNLSYRGKNCESKKDVLKVEPKEICYKEHNIVYLKECLDNLKMKKTIPYKFEHWEQVEDNVRKIINE